MILCILLDWLGNEYQYIFISDFYGPLRFISKLE